MDVYSYTDYRGVIRAWAEEQPNNGRGSGRKIANHLNVSTVLVSQVLSGKREFSLEQGLNLADLMMLGSEEKDYFFLLLNREKAGTHQLNEYFEKKINQHQDKRKNLKSIIKHDSLSELDQAQFYSSWLYSATRLSCDISHINSSAGLADFLSIDPKKINTTLDFLIEKGLVTKQGSKFTIGLPVTHLGKDSPLINLHHENWRRRAAHKRDSTTDSDQSNLYYTGPMVISKKLGSQVFLKLRDLIREITEEAKASKSEELYCLGIDWFKAR